jgi:hypothetical protein
MLLAAVLICMFQSGCAVFEKVSLEICSHITGIFTCISPFISSKLFAAYNRWWQSWIDYVIEDLTSNGSHHHDFGLKAPRRPGAINNTNLIDDTASYEVSSMEIELHDTLVEGRDYILLPQQVWETLHNWYVSFVCTMM